MRSGHPEPDERGRVTYNLDRDPTVTQEIDDVQVTFWIGEGIDQSLRIEMPPGVALDFAATLTRAAGQAAKAAARQLAIGECETCRNSRLVQVEVRGRTVNERCPDCRARYFEANIGFPAFPRIGGGVS